MNRDEPEALAQRLVANDAEAWTALTQAIAAGDADLWPELARELLERDRVGVHLDRARRHIGANRSFDMVTPPIRRFEKWFTQSAIEALDPDDRRSFILRERMIAIEPGPDGGLASSIALLADLDAHDIQPLTGAEALLAAIDDESTNGLAEDVALRIVAGAFTMHDFETARTYAARVAHACMRARDTERYWYAQRRLAAANLGLGRLEEAFAVLEAALQRRGRGPEASVSVSRRVDDPKIQAIDEMVAITVWANLLSPEYVRAIGGLAERWDDEHQAETIWDNYERALERLFTESRQPERDIGVIVEQSGQRGLVDTPAKALVVYLNKYPDDDWAQQQVDIIASYARLDMLREKLSDEPDLAIAGLFEMFEDRMQDGTLEDGKLGFQVADALTKALLHLRDERAIDVQRRLLDHKVATFGECPATWLERQNLGTVLGQLGRPDEGKPLVEDALKRLRDYFGDDDPYVDMAQRNLEKLNASTD